MVNVRLSEIRKKHWRDPEKRRKHIEALNRPEVSKKHSASLKAFYQTEAGREQAKRNGEMLSKATHIPSPVGKNTTESSLM